LIDLVLAGSLLPAAMAEDTMPPARNPFDLGWTTPLDTPGPITEPVQGVAAEARRKPPTGAAEAKRVPPPPAPPASDWTCQLRLLGGWDTNITQEPLILGNATGHTGVYEELAGTAGWRFLVRGPDSFHLGVTALGDDYPGNEIYRFLGAGSALSWNHLVAPWFTTTTAAGTRYWLAGEPAAQVGTGSFTVGYLDLPRQLTLLNLTGQRLQYTDQADSSGLAGSIGCRQWYLFESGSLQDRFEVGLKLLYFKAGADYQSYASLAPGAALRTRLGGEGSPWRGCLAADVDARDYRGPVPGSSDRLNQALVLVRLEFMYVLTRHWEVGVVATHTQRLTHYADSEFVRQQFALSVAFSQ
jgi:hypothetical protein